MKIAKSTNLLVQFSKRQSPRKAGEGLEACRLHVLLLRHGTKDGKKMEDVVARLILQWSGTAGLGKGGNLTRRLKSKLRIPPSNLCSRCCLQGGFTQVPPLSHRPSLYKGG